MSKSKKKKYPGSSNGNSKDSSVLKYQNVNNAKEQLEENRNKPETKTNMETNYPNRNHPKRNFRDYIYEFIMIFVAITGSYFMENMRERVVEHSKEKEYIARLVRDVKEDTTNLKYLIRSNREQMEGLDSLAILIEKPVSSMDTIDIKKFIILLADNLNNFEPFNTRDITMSQLKSTGGLRLIKNSNVLDKIVTYYTNIEDYQRVVDINYKFVYESFTEEMKFIDFNHVFKTGKMDIADVSKMKGLGNRCFVFRIQIEAYNEGLKVIYKRGASLLKYLKKEYNLKDDVPQKTKET